MSIIAGAAIGAAAGVAAALLPRKVLGKDENRPPTCMNFLQTTSGLKTLIFMA